MASGWDAWFNAATSFLVLLFGLFVLTLRPRTRGSIGLSVYALGYGAIMIPGNLVDTGGDLGPLWLQASFAILPLAVFVGVLLVALNVPGPLPRPRAPLLIFPTAVALAVAAAAAIIFFASGDYLWVTENTEPGLERTTALGGAAVWWLLFGATFFHGTLIAVRAGLLGAAEASRVGQLAMLDVAVLLWFGIFVGTRYDDQTGSTWARYLAAMALAVTAATWLWAAGRHARPASRVCRVAAMVLLAVPIAAAAFWASFGDSFEPPGNGPMWGLSRLVAVGALGYSILRYRFLGLDVTMKWTVKQSTIAGIFIAVFFVVSESAQEVVAAGSGPWLGILATGILLFAISPVQRFAERVASSTLPGVKAVGEMDDDERADVYRDAVQAAWADGSLSRDERAMLDRLRQSLRLDETMAMRLEREAAAA